MSNLFKLEGTLFEHLDLIRKLEDEKRNYFRYGSKCWNAIVKSVYTDEDCPLITRAEGEFIMAARGEGPCIRFKDAWFWIAKSPGLYFCLEFEITFFYEDDKYNDYPPTHARKYEVKVPYDLEINFTEKKFKAWITEKKKERNEEQKKKDMKVLQALLKLYPAEARELFSVKKHN